jgi:hypothetical protein
MKQTRVEKFAHYREHILRFHTIAPRSLAFRWVQQLQVFFVRHHTLFIVFFLSLLLLISFLVLLLVFFGGSAL